MSRRVVAILNPVSGRRSMMPAIRHIGRLLERHGGHLEIAETTHPGHATELAAGVNPDVHAILAVGGDGTLCEVANGLRGKNVPVSRLGRLMV